MKLRYYQQEAIDSIWRYFTENPKGNPVVAMPTASGKTLVISGFIKSVYKAFPNQRIMILTHVKELIEQNFEKLLAVWPTAPAGIYSASIGRKDVYARITVAGIQSVIRNPAIFNHIDLIIIDECHLVSHREDTSYQKFITALKEVNPALRIIGLSATPYRLGLGMITDGGLFTDICYDVTSKNEFNRLLEEGFLCPLIPKRPPTELNLESVRLQGGEFVAKDLQQAVDKAEVTKKALLETLAYGEDRKHWLVFATGIEHAEHITECLNDMGIKAATVHSKLSKGKREEILAAFKAGRYRAVVNNNVLTTGFDFPAIDLIAMLRPTNSPALFVQMLGRGTRPVYAPCYDLTTREGRLAAIAAGPKQNCLVLDFASNTKRLGPINDPVLPKKKGKKGGTAPVRVCDQCSSYVHASTRICPYCNYHFPASVKFGTEASQDDVIAGTEVPVVKEFKVDRVVYQIHHKTGKPDSLKVSYYCGLQLFNNYVCLEHSGFAGKKARNWWRQHDPEGEVPTTTAEALTKIDTLSEPSYIRVWANKKYPQVLDYAFDGEFVAT